MLSDATFKCHQPSTVPSTPAGAFPVHFCIPPSNSPTDVGAASDGRAGMQCSALRWCSSVSTRVLGRRRRHWRPCLPRYYHARPWCRSSSGSDVGSVCQSGSTGLLSAHARVVEPTGVGRCQGRCCAGASCSCALYSSTAAAPSHVGMQQSVTVDALAKRELTQPVVVK